VKCSVCFSGKEAGDWVCDEEERVKVECTPSLCTHS
jgi:hypothetical protein